MAKKSPLQLIGATLIGLAVGGLYVLPLALYFGDPLSTVHSYSSNTNRWLFGLPFYAIIKGTILYPPPVTNLVLSFGWVFFILFGSILMVAKQRFRQYPQTHPVEVIFATLYLLAIYSYNLPFLGAHEFSPDLPSPSFLLCFWRLNHGFLKIDV